MPVPKINREKQNQEENIIQENVPNPEPIKQQPTSFWQTINWTEIATAGRDIIQTLRTPKNNLGIPNNPELVKEHPQPQQPTEEEIKKQRELEEEFVNSDPIYIERHKEITEIFNLYNQKLAEQQKDFQEFVKNKNNPIAPVKKLEGEVKNLSQDINSIKEMLIQLTSNSSPNENKGNKR